MCNYSILQSENEKALSPLLFYVAISNTCFGKNRPVILSRFLTVVRSVLGLSELDVTFKTVAFNHFT
jgi:hypothetical protein